MDREKEDRLPDMQVEFIDSICLPVYKVRGKTVTVGVATDFPVGGLVTKH